MTEERILAALAVNGLTPSHQSLRDFLETPPAN
jgi:hypothetical protein